MLLLAYLLRGSEKALAAQMHHAESREIPVTVGRLWAKCGHGPAM
jgi:hypothetical protein